MMCSCPNCDGEGTVAAEPCGTDSETGWTDYALVLCDVCHGRGGFGAPHEMAVTTGTEEAAAE